MKRLFGSLLLAAAVTFGASTEAEAQFTFGPMAAYHDDMDFGVGAGFTMPTTGIHEQVGLWGSFLYFFPDAGGNFGGVDVDVSYFEINGGLYYDFVTSGSITPYALAGLVIARFSADVAGFGNSDTDIGLNLGGGIKTMLGDSMTGLVGARLELQDGSGFVIEAGLGFPMGG